MIDLDGADWRVREALGENWRWYVDTPVGAPWLPATVPGSVVTDLWRAGELPDPYHGRNSRAAEWTGTRSWVYRHDVDLPALRDGEWATLQLDGIDPSGRVFCDGHELARVDGLYRPVRVRLATGPVAAATHRLAVVVDPVPASVPQVGRTEEVSVHRPRMNEGWDFCPRFPHQGIWRHARIVIGAVQLADLAVRTELDDAGTGHVLVDAVVEGECPVRAQLIDSAGYVVAEEVGDPPRLELTIADPARWWPRGFGPQATYTVVLWLADQPVATRIVGFRSATMLPNPGAPASALAYTAVVNDVVIPLLGWNWVPADAQHGAVDERCVRHLVELAAESGARLLRVWGGGLVETEEFYRACDEAGLLVWQEFSQSSSGISSEPASDAAFVVMMVEEAEIVVPARAHHPSLLLWDAGNELGADGTPLDEARSPVIAALADAVARLDPGRAWLPTSPSGPQHDVHGPWEHQGLTGQHTLYNAGTSLAHTEFGVEGMTNRRALATLVSERDQWPTGKTNPVYRHLGEWWNNTELLRESFGDRLSDVESIRRASQLLQATGLGYAVEADRRRFPYCSMILPWQLNESYPNAWCTSAVDHRGEPKPAFHAVARAFAPQRVTVRVPSSVGAGKAEGWVWSERGVAAGSRVVARLRDADGTVLGEACWEIDEPVREPHAVGTLSVESPPRDAVVVWDLTWFSADGEQIDRELVLACTGTDFAPLLDLGLAQLSVDVFPSTMEVVVTHLAGPVVVGLRIADDRPGDATGWIIASGDPRPLLPGEQRTFTIRGGGVLLESWNTEPVRIDLDRDQELV